MTDKEFANLKSQIVISSWGGSRRAKPYAFTEQGVAMLSSVLRSKRAIEINIAIIRTFVKLREMLATNKELAKRLEDFEKQLKDHDEHIEAIFVAIQRLVSQPDSPRKKKIGFEVKEPRAKYKKRARN